MPPRSTISDGLFLSAVMIAVGLALGGWFIGHGFTQGRSSVRYVEVKGLAQFATDSRSALGGIRQASQGVFVILPRDQAPGVNESGQLQKIVRVVSTVQYILR